MKACCEDAYDKGYDKRGEQETEEFQNEVISNLRNSLPLCYSDAWIEERIEWCRSQSEWEVKAELAEVLVGLKKMLE